MMMTKLMTTLAVILALSAAPALAETKVTDTDGNGSFSKEELKAALKKTSDRPTLVLISRQGSNLFLTVKPANG